MAPSDGFEEFADDLQRALHDGIENVKRIVGPVSNLLNPQSSKATQEEIERLKARETLLESLLNIQITTISRNERELNEVTLERDALREQLADKSPKHSPKHSHE